MDVQQSNTLKSCWRPYEELRTLPSKYPIGPVLEGFDISERDLDRALAFLLGDQMNDDRPTVSRVLCSKRESTSLRQALDDGLAQTGTASAISRANRIVVKANLIEARAPADHVTVHHAFLDALLEVLRQHATNATILVADGSGHERDSQYILQTTGIGEVLAKHGIRFVDLNCDDVTTVSVPEPLSLPYLHLPTTVVESDYIISLARLKTHHWTGVSLAMKNLFGTMPGCIYGFPKNKLHWLSFPRVMADIVSVVRPQLSIVDGITGMEGDGPLDGHLRDAGIIFLGTNAFSTDYVATKTMGFSPALIPQFWHGALKAAGSPKPNTIGPDVQFFFRPPPPMPWLYESASLHVDEISALCRQLRVDLPDQYNGEE